MFKFIKNLVKNIIVINNNITYENMDNNLYDESISYNEVELFIDDLILDLPDEQEIFLELLKDITEDNFNEKKWIK